VPINGLQVAVDSRGDLRSFGDLCQVIISLGDDPDTGVALPLRDLLPSNDPEAFHASLPTFYDGRPECSAEVCYKPSLLPGSRRYARVLINVNPTTHCGPSPPHLTQAFLSITAASTRGWSARSRQPLATRPRPTPSWPPTL
jgi:hypothetical protein